MSGPSKLVTITMDMSIERVYHNVHVELGMTKLSTSLGAVFTECISRTCKKTNNNLRLFNVHSEDFWHRFVTVNKRRLYDYMLESNRQSQQSMHRVTPPPKKAKMVSSF